MRGMPRNRLAAESSPYLLQHAQNPVDWHAWGPEALALARELGRPIFLSIGYSSCHWCHVMAHESFEDEDVAAFMNENFVNIKVDREERPDIDDVYQKACQMATGQGGWPLSVFLTPDQRPFFAGTYFPKLDSHGRPGFGSLCRQMAQAWRERPGDVGKTADGFVGALRGSEAARGPEAGVDRQLLDEAAVTLLGMGDQYNGGFGSAPKFPNAACVSFLLRHARMSGISRFSKFALMTLRRMARGGMFDQIGGGFHRYSTDAKWLVPHFEKMLYDNALIPVNYAEAYQVTGDGFYLGVMRKTLDFVLREMRSPEGGFYSAYDADSAGGEGLYYVWTKAEIVRVLGGDAELFCLYYDVTDGGNWEGSSILCNSLDASAVAFRLGMGEGEVRRRLEECSARLLEARSARERPGLDDKVLTSWNALMITALARGHGVAQDGGYLDAASAGARFIMERLLTGGRLLRTYKGGAARIDGYLEDYAFLAGALVDLFCADPEPAYLEAATGLGMHMLDHFWDEESGGFFMTSDGHEELIVRPRSGYDLSLPSGNSAAAAAMVRLYHLTQEGRFLDAATRVMDAGAGAAAQNPFAFGHLLNAISDRVAGMAEIVAVNPENAGLCSALRAEYVPNSLLVTVRTPGQLAGLSGYPFFEGKEFGQGTEVFVCKDRACSPPLHDMDGVRGAL